MKKAFWIAGTALLTVSAGLMVSAQTTGQRASTPSTASTRAAAAPSFEAPKAVLDEYCVECHNKNAKTAGLAIDALDIAHVQANVPEWEKIVKKLRAGHDASCGSGKARQPDLHGPDHLARK
jgi:uncharacterized membrane protein